MVWWEGADLGRIYIVSHIPISPNAAAAADLFLLEVLYTEGLPGMIRSFRYAARNALLLHASVRPEEAFLVESWAEPWY